MVTIGKRIRSSSEKYVDGVANIPSSLDGRGLGERVNQQCLKN